MADDNGAIDDDEDTVVLLMTRCISVEFEFCGGDGNGPQNPDCTVGELRFSSDKLVR